VELGLGDGERVGGIAPGRLDAEGAAVRALLAFLLALIGVESAQAHLGSPDVFYDGQIGAYRAAVTIRMPTVVPGRAMITVQAETPEALTVTFRPIFNKVALSNAPPAEQGVTVAGETNLYSGELWLMTSGAYSIEVAVRGPAGHGTILIPVNSIATKQLPLPRWLGATLAALGLLLVLGAVAIVAAAVSESVLPLGAAAGVVERRRRRRAAALTAVVLALALWGGAKWWSVEEQDFRARIRDGGWPDLTGTVRVEGGQRVLALTLGRQDLEHNKPLDLAPDHGKLLHLFLVRQPAHDAFAHIHPVRKGNHDFEVALPALPEGDYEMFCDLTLDGTGFSSTATNLTHVPALTNAAVAAEPKLIPDTDDSWAAGTAGVPTRAGEDAVFRLTDGRQLIWKAHPALRANHDAALHFEARDAAGKALELEPYMGMMSHVAVMRSDARVFAHLHPTGNFSMAAQMVFDSKMGVEDGMAGMAGIDHSKMGHMMHQAMMGGPVISLPYQFPSAGQYRLWVQVKADGDVLTGIFDATVE
jgi:hypothetical protein